MRRHSFFFQSISDTDLGASLFQVNPLNCVAYELSSITLGFSLLVV